MNQQNIAVEIGRVCDLPKKDRSNTILLDVKKKLEGTEQVDQGAVESRVREALVNTLHHRKKKMLLMLLQDIQKPQ